MSREIFTRYEAPCTNCSRRLTSGARAYYQKGQGLRCNQCGPHELKTDGFHITILPEATAYGAVDSSKPNLHASHGVNHQQGQGRREAIPVSRYDTPPGKRRRLPSRMRRAAQRNND